MPSPTPEPENEHEALRLFRERLDAIAKQHPKLLTPEQHGRLTDYLITLEDNDDDPEE